MFTRRRVIIAAILVACMVPFYLYTIDLNSHVTMWPWVSTAVDRSMPVVLPMCESLASYRPLKRNISPGLTKGFEYVCFDYAKLVTKGLPSSSGDSIIFHTYWSARDTPHFDDLHLGMVQTFAATQDKSAKLWVWIRPADENALVSSPKWKSARKAFGYRLKHVVANDDQLTTNTPLRMVRNVDLPLFVLYQHGGVWFDINTLFIRNLKPLLVEEWTSSQGCEPNAIDTSMMYFTKQSPFLCQVITTVSQRNDPLSLLFTDTYYDIWKFGVQAWTILPWCYTHPTQCDRQSALPGAYDDRPFDTDKLESVFTYRWNQRKDRSPGSVIRHLLDLHQSGQ